MNLLVSQSFMATKGLHRVLNKEDKNESLHPQGFSWILTKTVSDSRSALFSVLLFFLNLIYSNP